MLINKVPENINRGIFSDILIKENVHKDFIYTCIMTVVSMENDIYFDISEWYFSPLALGMAVILKSYITYHIAHV